MATSVAALVIACCDQCCCPWCGRDEFAIMVNDEVPEMVAALAVLMWLL